MALKFDGKLLKDGSKTLCNVRGNKKVITSLNVSPAKSKKRY